MVTQFNIQTDEVFTVSNPTDYRFGKTFKCLGFRADKWGIVFAVCEWLEERGYKSSYIFYAGDFA